MLGIRSIFFLVYWFFLVCWLHVIWTISLIDGIWIGLDGKIECDTVSHSNRSHILGEVHLYNSHWLEIHKHFLPGARTIKLQSKYHTCRTLSKAASGSSYGATKFVPTNLSLMSYLYIKIVIYGKFLFGERASFSGYYLEGPFTISLSQRNIGVFVLIVDFVSISWIPSCFTWCFNTVMYTFRR